MKTRLVSGVEVHRGSANVFADLGLVDAEKLKIKTGLVIEIRKAMISRGLTQQVAAKRMGISQPKVSDMMRGDFTNLSERKLMDCLIHKQMVNKMLKSPALKVELEKLNRKGFATLDETSRAIRRVK
ncbi:COG5606 Uncharacterized conserved small protein [Burkholderiaceae bacterium]